MPMRALIADDDPMSRRMLELVLSKLGYEMVAETNGLAALERLSGPNPPQLAILDWMMPQLDGIEVVRRVRALENRPYIYMLLLTSKTQSADVVKGLDSGADDYIPKPFNVNELQARLKAGERVLASQRALVDAREVVRNQSAIDAATGAFGRVMLQALVARDVGRARIERSALNLVTFAVDAAADMPRDIKDALLAVLTKRLARILRPGDALVRASDDHMCAILPNMSQQDVLIFAGHMLAASQSENVVTPKGVLNTGCSFGVASLDNVPADAAAFIAASRNAFEQARASGPGRVVASSRAAAPPPMPRATPPRTERIA